MTKAILNLQFFILEDWTPIEVRISLIIQLPGLKQHLSCWRSKTIIVLSCYLGYEKSKGLTEATFALFGGLELSLSYQNIFNNKYILQLYKVIHYEDSDAYIVAVLFCLIGREDFS